MTPPEAKAQITADFCEMVRLLRQIDPPERHRRKADPLALHWNRGDAIASVAHGAPITLRLHPRNDGSPSQLRVETRHTILQQRAHLRTWLDRATTGDGNVGAGHIRWSKLAKGLSGKLGEFTVRYAGKAQDSPGHIIVVETSGTPAFGFVTADGRPLNPHITFGNKSRMRQEMATALRAFGGATRLAPTLFATAA